MTQVVCLGEAMGELAFDPTGAVAVGVGGDCMNTAIYLAREGAQAAFATAVGEDPFGARIAALCAENGVDCGLIRRDSARATGLYAIMTDAQGERRFQYWRDSSAARHCLDRPSAPWLAQLEGAGWLYLSGITLWVMQSDAARLMQLLSGARARGQKIAFDGNYRPRLWGPQTAGARDLFANVMARADLLLPTFEDEQMLWGDTDAAACLARLRALGPAEIVLKQGPEGALLSRPGAGPQRVPVPAPVTPVDTTAAGDSFNAGYLAARLRAAPPEAAALAGHRLAGRVIRHRGAILPPGAP